MALAPRKYWSGGCYVLWILEWFFLEWSKTTPKWIGVPLQKQVALIVPMYIVQNSGTDMDSYVDWSPGGLK